MVEVKLNFDEIDLVPVAIKEVLINDKPLKFICETEKTLNKKGNCLVISNAVATNLVPSNDRATIHIISVYRNIATNEDVTVHERTYGEIKSVENAFGNAFNAPSSYEIEIEDVDLFDYTMEIKTEHEKLEDDIKALKREVEDIGNFYKDKLKQEEENSIKQIKELQDAINKQAKEFKNFKDQIHKAFGVGSFYIGGQGVTGAFNLSADNSDGRPEIRY